MKRFICTFMVFAIAVIFVGCSSETEQRTQTYPWSVILIWQFELSNSAVPDDSLKILRQSLETQEVDVVQDVIQVAYVFNDYKSFAEHFGLDKDGGQIDIVVEQDFLYQERTITFENPWKTVFDNATGLSKVSEVNVKVRTTLSQYVKTGAVPGYYYMFESSFRRTSVENTVDTSNYGSTYDYVFAYDANSDDPLSVDEVIIFDRFANQAIWYGLAVAATIIFMCGLYLILRARQKGAQQQIYITDTPSSDNQEPPLMQITSTPSNKN